MAFNRKVEVKASPPDERAGIIHTDKPTTAPETFPEPETNNGHQPRDENNQEWKSLNSCCFPIRVVAFSLLVTQWRWERVGSYETEEGCSAGDSRPHGSQNP